MTLHYYCNVLHYVCNVSHTVGLMFIYFYSLNRISIFTMKQEYVIQLWYNLHKLRMDSYLITDH